MRGARLCRLSWNSAKAGIDPGQAVPLSLTPNQIHGDPVLKGPLEVCNLAMSFKSWNHLKSDWWTWISPPNSDVHRVPK